MTTLSVIIPAYVKEPQHLTALLTCLNSLQAYASKQIPIEFLVQDDCSPAVLLPMLIPLCAANVVRNEQNLGFVGNVNAGAARSHGDILLFCNQDIMGYPASQNWDIALVNAFEEATIGIVGGKLVFPDNRLQSAGGLFDGRSQPMHRWLGYERHDLPEYSTPGEISWTTGAALAIRRELFVQLGGLDLAYSPSYFEDVDLCLRARGQGLKVWYEPRVSFVHAVGSTGGSPYFMHSAETFRKRWVDTKCVKPDMMSVDNTHPAWW